MPVLNNVSSVIIDMERSLLRVRNSLFIYFFFFLLLLLLLTAVGIITYIITYTSYIITYIEIMVIINYWVYLI